tara:strand:- start:14 stop:2143 length:2130 start_codon:yes stop_codon:yes gene_type:complete
MAKEGILIQRFDGGVNNKDSQKDLPEGFLAEAKNIDVSAVGRIKTPGKFEADTFGSGSTSISVTSPSFVANAGLFSFRTDEDIASGIDAGEFIAYTKGSGEVFIGNTADAMAEEFDINSNDPSNTEPVYYYANGGLRVQDKINTNSSTSTFVPLPSRGGVYETTAAAYHATTSVLTAPDMSNDVSALSSDTVDPNVSGTKYHDLGDPNTKDITVAVEAVSPQSGEADGLWAEGKYVIGLSYVYFDGQESKISTFSTNVDIADGQVVLTSAAIADAGMSKFIQGFRVYAKNFNDIDDEFRLVLDVDLEQGSRTTLGDDFDALQDEGAYFHTSDPKEGTAATNQYYAYVLQNPSSLTYSAINGFDLEEHAISFHELTSYRYDTAVVANQRAFVGNVFYKDTDGRARRLGDRIQYTPVRKYDTFPQSYFLDIGTNDGDEIVKLMEFQDRLFVYKKNKLFIIDITSGSDANWSVIGEFENRGVSSPGAVVKTDLGLVWANEHGLFAFFDTIVKLSNAIDDNTWATNVNAEKVQVGFIPKRNQILVLGDTSSNSSAGYIYDVVTQSIVNIDTSSVLVGDNVSNFIRFNQELCLMDETGEMRRFNTSSASHTIEIKTKEYDFGVPSSDKRLQKVYVTHKAGDNLTLAVAYDGGAFPGTNKFSSTALSTSGTMTQTSFVPTTVENCKSMQFKITGTAEADFELEDITVVYRRKGVR